MSRSKKAGNEVESDSDWDSLPGDVPQPGSSPEPQSHSPRPPNLSPAPPKQPYSKHPTSTKPTNMYKNPTHLVRKSGSATTFEDRSGGLWNDKENEDGDVKLTFAKENNNNNVKKNNEVIKEKKDSAKTRNVQTQDKNKKPPHTDFRDALTTPIPAAPNPREQHEMAGVNQAYRFENGDEVTMNHDSWDDSENDAEMRQNAQHQSTSESDKRMRQHLSLDSSHEAKHYGLGMMGNEGGYHQCNTSQNFENCCLIQVAGGPFDDRHRPSFFHGSKNHFHIKEDEPRASITVIAEKSEAHLQRFWREVFGVLQILINFFIIFILELFKTLILSIRYLLTGILYTTGDHFIKPLLSAVFNNVVQPFSVLLLNIFTIIVNLLKPVLALTREILSQVAIPIQAFRLFGLNWDEKHDRNTRTDVKLV